MNIAESMKHVLKTRGQFLFTDFWKNDFSSLMKEIKSDFLELAENGRHKLRLLRHQSFREIVSDLKEGGADVLTVMKVVPQRIKSGLELFKDDILEELEKLPDQKQKTLFCLKVMGALSGSTLSAFYQLKNSKNDFSFGGFRPRTAFAQFLVSQIIFRSTQIFLSRFLNEVEKNLTDDQDLKNVRYFKGLISNNGQVQEENEFTQVEVGDKALEVVENFKNYIITGERASS